jgi:hypothetical protein
LFAQGRVHPSDDGHSPFISHGMWYSRIKLQC